MKKIVWVSTLGLTAFLAVGCGGGSSLQQEPVTKVLFDDPVVGMNYQCSGSGVVQTTNAQGEFTCSENAKVTFSIGSYTLASTTVTANSGVSGNIVRFADMNLSDAALADVRQLLQTLDQTADDEVITLPDHCIKLNGVTVKPGENNFEAEVETFIGKPLVEETEANKRAEETYTKHLFSGKTWYAAFGSNVVEVSYDPSFDVSTKTVWGPSTFLSASWNHPKVVKVHGDYCEVSVWCPCTMGELKVRYYTDKEKAKAHVEAEK